MCIRVLQSLSKMNCPKANFEDFTLWCCPEGTYAERGGRLLSFSKDPRPECALPSATMTEDTGESSVGLWVSLTLSVLIKVFVCLCCRTCRKQQKIKKRKEEKERREEKRTVRKEKKKKSVGFRAKKEFERKQKERKMKKKKN